MELDKRIKEGKRPLNCFDTEQAKQFIGKKCYFSDDARDFMNLDKADGDSMFYVAELQNIWTAEEYCFADNSNDWCFILPLEWVKPEEPEKKYREYKDLDEFFDVTGLEIGDLIKLKFPGNNVAELLIVGGCNNGLFIGIHKYTFKQLFEIVEISISGEWQPFGVVDKAGEL